MEVPLISYYISLVNLAEHEGYSELSYLIMLLFKQPTVCDLTKTFLKIHFIQNRYTNKGHLSAKCVEHPSQLVCSCVCALDGYRLMSVIDGAATAKLVNSHL